MNTQELIAQNLFQKGNCIILICSESGTVTRASDYALEVFGERIISTHITELFIDFNHDIDLQALCSQDISQPEILSINTETELPDSFNFTFHRDDKNNIVVLGNLDREELKLMKQELVQNNNELLNLSRELQRKNAELDRLNKMKNEFLGMAAHDLRNPIGNIWTITEMIMMDETDVEVKHLEFISMIRNISESMLGLLNDLLDISAIESGKLKLDRQKNDIHKTINASEKLYLKLAENRSITIRKKFSPDVPEIIYDERKIQQVISNLISNALKYSYDNSEIIIFTKREKGSVQVKIQDFGVGIPQKDQNRLFKPFFRSAATSPAGEKSTGLGLAIVRKIINAHKGTITLQSRVGEGTTVSFTLPREEVESEK